MPEEHDPFSDSNSVQPSSNRDVLDRARHEYDAKNYASADHLYEEANRLDSRATTPYRELWAFCKLYVATEAVNKAGWVPPTEAEKEVLAALALCSSPELQRQGKELLRPSRIAALKSAMCRRRDKNGRRWRRRIFALSTTKRKTEPSRWRGWPR